MRFSAKDILAGLFLLGNHSGGPFIVTANEQQFSNPEATDPLTGQDTLIWAYPDSAEVQNALVFCLLNGFQSFVEYEEGCVGQPNTEYLHAKGIWHFIWQASGLPSGVGEENHPDACYQLFTSITCTDEERSRCTAYVDPMTVGTAGQYVEAPRRVWAFEAEGSINGPRLYDVESENSLQFCLDKGLDYVDSFQVDCDGRNGQAYHSWSRSAMGWEQVVAGLHGGEPSEDSCFALFTEIVCCDSSVPTNIPTKPPTPEPTNAPSQSPTPEPTTAPLPGGHLYAFACTDGVTSNFDVAFDPNGTFRCYDRSVGSFSACGSYSFSGSSISGTANLLPFSASSLHVIDNILVEFTASFNGVQYLCAVSSLDYPNVNRFVYEAFISRQQTPTFLDIEHGITMDTSYNLLSRQRAIITGNPRDFIAVYQWCSNNVLKIYFGSQQGVARNVLVGSMTNFGEIYLNGYSPPGPISSTNRGNIPASRLPKNSSPC